MKEAGETLKRRCRRFLFGLVLVAGSLLATPAGRAGILTPGATGTGNAGAAARHLRDLPIRLFVASMTLDQLQNLVVTETKIPQARETVTQKLEVLDLADLARQPLPHRNLADLVRYSSGQFVNPLSRNDANWGSFGGLGPKYNGYLLDGLPIDSFADAMSLDPWALERVELHKGPASVMYSNYLTMDFAGNETPLAGITNFLLKDRIETRQTRLALGAGAWHTTEGRLYHQDRHGRLGFFLGGGHERSDYTDYGTAGSWLNILADPGYRKSKAYVKLIYRFDEETDQQLSVFLHQARHEGDVGRPNRRFANRYDTVNAVWSRTCGRRLTLQLKTGWRSYDRTWDEDNFRAGVFPADLSLRENDGVAQVIRPSEIAFTLAHGRHGLLSFGADTQQATYETFAEAGGVRATGNDVSCRATGFYLQEKLIAGKWVWRAGGRVDDLRHSYDRLSGNVPEKPSNSWRKTVWSVGSRFNATPRVSWFANLGTSFVAPTAKQLGGTIKSADAGVAGRNGQLPSFGLSPEMGTGADLGLDLRLDDRHSLGLRGFHHRVQDAIVENIVFTNPSQTRSVNAGEAVSRGVELDLQGKVRDRLRWFANWTQTSTRVGNDLDPDQDGLAIPFVPAYVGNLGLTREFPGAITVSPYLQATGEYFDSISRRNRTRFRPVQVLNLRLRKEFREGDARTVTGILDLINLGNRRYALPWQFRDPGFHVQGSLEMTF
ncbi:MAG: TonB-dependent receptor [Candidatus Riflebacteria bacterium]|nr:TonB-dependent receptor [Candidatus Riflebacteria bacterium]